MIICVSICHLPHFDVIVGPVTSSFFSVLVTTVVFSGLVRPSSLLSGDGGVVSASLLDDLVRAVAGSSTAVVGEHSTSESLSMVTRSVAEPVLYVEPAGVPSSVDLLPSSVVALSHLAAADILGPAVWRLSVASSSPGPVDICVGTAATVVDDCIAPASGQVDSAVQIEAWLCVLSALIEPVKFCVPCKTLRRLVLVVFHYF